MTKSRAREVAQSASLTPWYCQRWLFAPHVFRNQDQQVLCHRQPLRACGRPPDTSLHSIQFLAFSGNEIPFIWDYLSCSQSLHFWAAMTTLTISLMPPCLVLNRQEQAMMTPSWIPLLISTWPNGQLLTRGVKRNDNEMPGLSRSSQP